MRRRDWNASAADGDLDDEEDAARSSERTKSQPRRTSTSTSKCRHFPVFFPGATNTRFAALAHSIPFFPLLGLHPLLACHYPHVFGTAFPSPFFSNTSVYLPSKIYGGREIRGVRSDYEGFAAICHRQYPVSRVAGSLFWLAVTGDELFSYRRETGAVAARERVSQLLPAVSE